MIWGALVADAAALGTHWIYNLEDLKAKYPDGIKGFEAPLPGHYHAGKQPGDQTHYGDAALVLLETVAQSGSFDPVAFGESFVTRMDPQNYSGYLDSATRGTLETYRQWAETHPGEAFDFQQGADDDQLASITSIAPVVALTLSDPQWVDTLTAATRVRQNNARAVAYVITHARILRELLQGIDLHSALHRVEEEAAKDPNFGLELKRRFSDAFARKHLSPEEATGQLGQSCPLISSFPSALAVAIQNPEDFADTILRVIRSGGDNAGRAAIVGAWLGASLGQDAIPAAWIERLSAKERISKAISTLQQNQEE